MDPVVVLDAAMTVGAARSALDLVLRGQKVVVRSLHPRALDAVLWYCLDFADLARVTDPTIADDVPLGVSLEMHGHVAWPGRQLDDPQVKAGVWTGLVVDGTRAVGWATQNPRTDPPRTRGSDPSTGEVPGRNPLPDWGAVGEKIGAVSAPVEVFPRVDVPEAVLPGATFDVIVGLSKQAQAGVQGAAMLISTATKEITIQIKAENFIVPDVRFILPFNAADVGANSVAIAVTAPLVDASWRGRIEIEYSLNGLLIGTAWRELVVTSSAPDTAPPSSDGGEVAVDLEQTLPIDLTVSISRGEASGTFLWTFTTPHHVELPNEQVLTQLERETAETFALRKVREMSQVSGTPLAALRINGVATEVASVMPVWFWTVLTSIWQLAKKAGRLPTLLLVSQESLVPWELASTSSSFITDRSLIDTNAPEVLGAQLIMGRWRPAGPATPSGVQHPGAIPAEAMAITSLAVVVGEFGGSGMPALKAAIEEGRRLTTTYPSVWVKGTISDVAALLEGRLTDKGTKVEAQVLHVASHGEVDPDTPILSGVLVSDSAVRIDEAIMIGSTFINSASPLVFLSCCQVASAAGGSLTEGGLAAACLRAGARAFIAPLWSVNDTLARDTALDFYTETLGKGRPVGDVMRELRARFTPERDQTTHLAYAYYGHPSLALTPAPPDQPFAW